MNNTLPIAEDPPHLTAADFIAMERELCSRSLAAYVRRAWPIIEPSNAYVHGWHIDAICAHLEAITRGEITRLAIAVPPGTMKSLLVSVLWPTWEWGPQGMSWLRVVATSHKSDLTVRDNIKCRRIVQSEWYQRHWGDKVKLTGDQNAKTKFENTASGFREACAFSSLTGVRGDRLIIDDPLSVDDAFSFAEISNVGMTFREAVPTRLIDPEKSAIIVIQQRLHTNDVIGIIENSPELNYELLVLPMEYEEGSKCRTSIGFEDPRTEEGELLFPERFPRSVLDVYRASLGQYGWASQMQQRPAPREGGILSKKYWRTWEKASMPKFEYVLQSWDTAFTEEAHKAALKRSVASYSARTTWGVFSYGSTNHIMLLEMWRDRVSYPDLRKEAQRAYKEYKPDAVLIEKKASGQSLLQDLRMANIPVIAYNPDRDKVARAHAVSAMLEAGMIWTPDRKWARDVVDLCAMFPSGDGSDIVDTCTQAWLRIRNMRFTEHPDDDWDDDDDGDNVVHLHTRIRKPVYG